MQKSAAQPTLIGMLAALWGIGGFFYIVGSALLKLATLSLEAFDYSLSPLQWALLLSNVVFMAYSEGYKGFQQQYAPRFAARVKHLRMHGSPIERLLAPLFCMNFFNAPKKRIITTFVLLFAIIMLVTLFRLIPQPWRGIIDAGVVVGLTWGLIASLWFCVKSLFDSSFDVDPEVIR